MSSARNEMQLKRGHRRTTSTATWNKAQPVTDLLLNLPSHNMSTLHLAETCDTSADTIVLEKSPMYFQLDNKNNENELQQCTTTTTTMQKKTNKKNKDDDDDDNYINRKHHYDNIAKKKDMPICLNCTRNSRAAGFTVHDNTINAMCRILCNENCQRKFTLEGCMKKKEQLNKKLPKSKNHNDFNDDDDVEDEVDRINATVDVEDVATTLAKVDAMTSTVQIKQRLAARKLEMELDRLELEYRNQREYCDEITKNNNNNDHNSNDEKNIRNEFMRSENIPTRDLLLYFLR